MARLITEVTRGVVYNEQHCTQHTVQKLHTRSPTIAIANALHGFIQNSTAFIFNPWLVLGNDVYILDQKLVSFSHQKLFISTKIYRSVA